MKNNFLQGIISGFIFTLLINSICCVTFYGLEYGIASSGDVFIINLVFMIISIFIAFVLKKLKILNKMNLISNVLLVLFGILILSSIFYEKIRGIITVDYIIPGPVVQVPSILWLIIILCITIRSIGMDENQKYGLLKFLIGEIISLIILGAINLILFFCINSFHNALAVNKIINNIIQGICSIWIIMYSTYLAKKSWDSYK